MSPLYGIAATGQLTDQRQWDLMIEALPREMPGRWERLEADLGSAIHARILEASEELNFGNCPGVFVGNWCWSPMSIKHTEEELAALLSDEKHDRGHHMEDLECQLKVWKKLTADAKSELTARLQETGTKHVSCFPPFALQLLQGEHPCLPRYARHFRSMASKNVDFGIILRIMKRFFPSQIYSTGYECEGGRPQGVPLARDGTSASFYAGLAAGFATFDPPVRITAKSLAALSADSQSVPDQCQHVTKFFKQKLPDDTADQVVRELRARKGSALSEYSENEIAEICGTVAGDAFRVQLDVGRGLMRLHDGLDTWSSTVSGHGSSLEEAPTAGQGKVDGVGTSCQEPDFSEELEAMRHDIEQSCEESLESWKQLFQDTEPTQPR